MPIQFNCPSCRRVIRADVASGTQVRCPLCSQLVEVPGPIERAAMPTILSNDDKAAAPSSRLAMGALVCGVLGMIGCWPCAMIGLVLGIVALVRIRNSPAKYGGTGKAVCGMCAAAVGIALIPLVHLPGMVRARENSRRVLCHAQMHAIGKALFIYAQSDPGGKFPEAGADLPSRLSKSGDVTPGDFLCPSTNGEPGTCSYMWIPGYDPGPRRDPNQIILYELIENHGGEGGNILYADGHVVFMKAPHYEREIAAVERFVRQAEGD